jgi:tetratricopeptide (TPR) repeat protein
LNPVLRFAHNALMAFSADTIDRILSCLRDSGTQKSPPLESRSSRQPASYIAMMLGLLALTYALIAGLRTVADMDLGWQLATGRWIVQHHSIPSTDVLSYTARGQEWIYPVLAQVLLYCAYAVGGYSLLSWLGAAACVGTVVLQLRRGGEVTALLAVIAVPLIAARTAPRAEMFTEVLFAAFLSVLWHYHRSGRGMLWLLPILMCLWTNVHLGFIAGLGICVFYVALELGEAAVASLRPVAFKRLRHAAPWLLATAVATLLNPWGARIYVAVARQGDVLGTHSKWIREWSGLRITTGKLSEMLAWREPSSALWWLILAAIVAALFAVYMRRIVPALLLAASVYLVIQALRMRAPFASVVVVVGGSILADAIGLGWARRFGAFQGVRRHQGRAGTALFLAAVVLFVAVRVSDLVTNRYYLKTPQLFNAFGPGVSSWYPNEAAAFLLREQLPGNIFNDYTAGGFVAWALSPSYPDYIDGRAIPFGDALLIHSIELLAQPLDSPAWQLEAENRNLNTILFSADHELSGSLGELGTFCASRQWRPVYLDTHAAIFVRVKPETAALLSRLQIDCNDIRFDHPPEITGNRGRAEAFRYYVNAAYILLALGKPAEAMDSLDRAGSIFSDSAFLHLARGFALQNLGRRADAERELYTSSELGCEDATWALAIQYEQLGRYADEARILSHAAERSDRPHWLYLRLGYAQLALGQPHEALISFDRADKESPFVGDAAVLGEAFRAQVAEGRHRALHFWSGRLPPHQ